MKTFKSADGSTRCLKCHLHLDQCTCHADNSMVKILSAIFYPMAARPSQNLIVPTDWQMAALRSANEGKPYHRPA
jgi:hypothetical protein